MPNAALKELLDLSDLPASAADWVEITGSEPVMQTRYKVGTAAAAAQAALGVAASELWRLRTGRRQRVKVDVRTAAIGLAVLKYTYLDGRRLRELAPNDPFLQCYPVRGGGWIRVQTSFPHLRKIALEILGNPSTLAEADAATAKWDGRELEEAMHAAGGCAGLVRTAEEWAAHLQSAAVARQPLIEIRRLGDAPPEPLPEGDRPLAGVRVLDLTRVIAGPICGRTLAEHGADVLKINSPHLDNSGYGELEPGLGKRAAFLDLRADGDRERLRALVRGADVFSQGYRPGALGSKGFSPEEVARVRPGIVYVELSAFGSTGPWRGRRGYDPVIQAVSGMIRPPADGSRPSTMPVASLDYLTGYFMALGAMIALRRRAQEGGSWLVRTSLARTGAWLADRGEFAGAEIENLPEPSPEEIDRLSIAMASPAGRLRFLKPVVEMDETPAFVARPAVPLGYHQPVWEEAEAAAI